MTTYIYETIPTQPGEEPAVFEFRQPMTAPPLITHPSTGQPVRRVISGGLGVMTRAKESRDATQETNRRPAPCGASCGCH